MRDALDASAAQLLPGRYTRLSVASERMPALYRAADVFLHLSKEEAFGNVYLEAMACALPIVGHDSVRLRWIVGDHEFLTNTDDPAAVVRQIELARNAPPALREKRLQKAADFSWPKIGRSYREFLQEVVAL
jgi:glycosyltransferase involved in cell wall biosynthesis